MSINDRIERLADTLEGIGDHLFNGTGLVALNVVIYGAHNGMTDDVFVSFAQSYGTNLAIMMFALIIVAAMWGAIITVGYVVAFVTAVPHMVRAIRGTRDAGV